MTGDLRDALRTLVRQPGFSAIVVATLGLGIGAVTVMFAALWGVVLRPLPFPEPERLVWVEAVTDRGSPNSLSALDYEDYREGAQALASSAAQFVWRPGVVISGGDEPERAVSSVVSGSLFQTLGVPPARGRSFHSDEEVSGGPEVVVISHGFWQRRYGGRAGVLGSTVHVDGVPTEIVGVMPEGFEYPGEVDLWLPLRRGSGAASGRGNNNFFMIGRLAEGASQAQAQAQLDVVAARISNAFPDSKGGWGVTVKPLQDQLFGDLRPLMITLMAATALLLLLTVANVASLFLARALGRQREFAVRLSIGASPWRVARHVLVQSLVLSGIGAIVGVALARLGVHAVKVLGPADLPRLASIEVDGRVLLFTGFAAVLAGLALGLAPALRAGRVELTTALQAGGHSTQEKARPGLRSALVAVQVALSFVLLVGFALFLRSSWQLQQVDPGLDPDGLLTVDVQLPTDPDEGTVAPAPGGPLGEMVDRVRELSGVVDAAGADQLPLFGGPYNGVHRGDRTPQTPSEYVPATRRIVTEDFFRTMGIRLQAGRGFERTDAPGSRPVTVVSRMLAERLYPNEDPLERIMVLPWGDGIPMTIVGVADDVRDFGPATEHRPAFYMSFRQLPYTLTDMRLAIRTAAEPTALVPSVRAAIQGVDKNAPLFRVGTMRGWLAESTARSRFTAILLCAFAALALLLSATGLYGVTASYVAMSRRSIGIRVALGARPRQAIGRVFARAGLMAGAGLVVGLLASVALARVVRSLLFEVEPAAPGAYLWVVLVLALVVLAACAVPAWRAATIDPAGVLRHE
jgi:putative ABC transport system permease protein